MKRAITAVLAGLGLLSVSVLRSPPAAAAASAEDCVRFSQSAQDGTRVVVDASRSIRAFASAKDCGDNWDIDEVSSSCAPRRP